MVLLLSCWYFPIYWHFDFSSLCK